MQISFISSIHILLRSTAYTILFFLSLSLCSKCVFAEKIPNGKFRVGTFLSVTGQASFIGAPALATLKLYVNLLNLQGGLLGRKVELIDYDVGIDPRTAQIAVKRLIFFDKVKAIIGGSTSGAAMSVIPIVTRAKIPFIALASSSSIINPVRKWVFKSSQTNRMACGSILGDMKKRGIKTIGLISGDDGFASSMRIHCLDVARIMGISVIADEIYRTNTRKVVSPLNKIKLKSSIQSLLNVDFGSSPSYVTRRFRQLGFKVPLYQTHGVATLDFLDLSGIAANGVRMPVPPIVIAEKLHGGDPIKPVLLSYIKLYKKRWEVAPNVYGSHAFDGLRIYVAAVRQAGSFDSLKIRQFLEKTNNYIGANGVVKMSSDDHLGLPPDAFRMVEIQNGEWVPIN